MRKKVLTIGLLTLIVLTGINFEGVTHSTAPLASKAGDPGQNDCTQCHGGSPNTGTGNITFTFPDTAWTPDSTYSLSITVTDASKSRFGFEMTALDGSNNKAGSFIVSNTINTGIVTGNSREYIAHKSASSTQTWNFDWKAPSSGSVGDITFYFAGNAADNNNNQTGDLIYTSTTLVEVIDNAPVVTEILTGPSDITINENANASFSISSENETGFQWQEDKGTGFNDITDGGIYSGATTATLNLTSTPLANNGFSYRCIVSGTPDVTSSDAILTVNALKNISKTNNIKIGVYPNPTSDYLNIESITKIYSSKIYTKDGKFVSHNTFRGESNKLDIRDLVPNTYILSVFDKNGLIIGTSQFSKL